jgi:tetratricopeptide (TPR) repeat protein
MGSPDIEEIYLSAKSRSQSDPYEVCFALHGNTLFISCSCPAAEKYMHCRHRIALIGNQVQALDNPSDPEQLQGLQKAQEWINRTNCRQEIQRLKELEEAAEELKTLKATLDKHFDMGFPLQEEGSHEGTVAVSPILQKTPALEFMTYWQLQELARERMSAITASDIASYSEVIKLFELSIDRDHTLFTKARTHRTLGEIYQRCGLPKKTIEHFEIALRLDPGIGIRKALAKLQAE